MKKRLAGIIAVAGLAVLTMSLAACGSSSSDTTTDSSQTATVAAGAQQPGGQPNGQAPQMPEKCRQALHRADSSRVVRHQTVRHRMDSSLLSSRVKRSKTQCSVTQCGRKSTLVKIKREAILSIRNESIASPLRYI